MKVWTVYEMANRRGPGAVYKYWAWYGGSGTGEERAAGSLLGHCWHLASPRRVSGSEVVVRVLMLAWIFAFVVFRALAAPIAVVMVAESGFFNVLASVSELAALTAGFFGCVLCILVAAVLFWGRQGWGLGIPSPFVGAVLAAGIFASVRGFGGPRGQGLGISWPLPGCQSRFFARSRRVSVSVIGAPFCSGVRVFLEPPLH